MPERIACRIKLDPGQAAEYEKRRHEIFPEPVDALEAFPGDAVESRRNHARVQVSSKRVFDLP